MRRIDALHANQRIFIVDKIDDVDESLQPYYLTNKPGLFQLV